MSGSTASSNRHRQTLGILLGLWLLMTGCTITSTPEWAIRSAVSTAKFHRVGNAQEVMTGSALEAFGTKEGLTTLREKLSKILFIRPIPGSPGYFYIVSGLTEGGRRADYRVQIQCEDIVVKDHVPAPREDHRASQYQRKNFVPRSSEAQGYDYDVEIPHCRVSEIVASAP